MNFRLLQSLGQLGQKGASGGSRASTIPVVKSSGPLRMRHFELAPYASLEIEGDVDAIWRPGPPRARLRLRESLVRHLKLEQFGQTLRVGAACDFEGERPLLEISGPQLAEVHLGAASSASLYDVRCEMLIASAFERSHLRAQGHARELHVESNHEASVDCASLVCEIAIADLGGESVALLRAEAALQAETRDACHLLTIGSPRILDVRRHNNAFSLQTFAARRPAPAA